MSVSVFSIWGILGLGLLIAAIAFSFAFDPPAPAVGKIRYQAHKVHSQNNNNGDTDRGRPVEATRLLFHFVNTHIFRTVMSPERVNSRPKFSMVERPPTPHHGLAASLPRKRTGHYHSAPWVSKHMTCWPMILSPSLEITIHKRVLAEGRLTCEV